MANITGDGNFTSELNQARNSSPAGIIEFLSALNIFLSITASLGNVLILIALHKVSSIYPPTKLFFRCLAVTDLCVGLIVQPLYATFLVSHITEVDENVVYYAHFYIVVSWILSGVSGSFSVAISVDRLLALLLGLRYRHVVTLRRVRIVIICFCLLLGSTRAIGEWLWKPAIDSLLIPFYTTLSLATSIFCYTRIRLRLRHQQVQQLNNAPQGQANEGRILLNIARYKKMLATVLWVQLALVACYIPVAIIAVLERIGIETHVVAFYTAYSLVYLNSSLNPILYCWKIREVRRTVKYTIRQIYCL